MRSLRQTHERSTRGTRSRQSRGNNMAVILVVGTFIIRTPPTSLAGTRHRTLERDSYDKKSHRSPITSVPDLNLSREAGNLFNFGESSLQQSST